MAEETAVGIVGLGKMGIIHLAILNALEGSAVRAVAERRRIIRSGVRSVLPEVPVFCDLERMLAVTYLDAVFITSPTAAHVGMAEACLERGLDVFIEKPLGVSGKSAGHLVKLAAERGIIGMVGYCKHFVETFAKAKEVLTSGVLGAPIHFSSCMYVSQLFDRGSGWRYKKESSGGGVLNILATHLVDLLIWFFGPVESVSGSVSSFYSGEVEDFVHAHLTFQSGPSGYLDASWSVRNYRLPEIRIEVQCENGMLAVTDDYVKYVLDSNGTFRIFYRQDLFEGVEVYVGGAEYAREDRYFLDCVRTREEPVVDLTYGYEVQRVTDAVYESAEAGRTVVLRQRG